LALRCGDRVSNVEGSVRKVAGKVRITGQLIDAATGAHLWAHKIDGLRLMEQYRQSVEQEQGNDE
jgi:hypothetical protein